MFGWIELGPKWASEDCYRVIQILKHNRIPCRMPADDMFFVNPFHLPNPDRRWGIRVRRRDRKRALALLAREGLVRDAADDSRAAHPQGATPAARAAFARRIPRDTARSGFRGLKPPARRAPV